ncbi:hypothetical protein [Sodalis sp. RH22]|uniref:hypothetical protein n=1 Tax=unclassified Sodalis (in: enterobacteria) TaxID=2636512 RepID=UPI0039B4B3E4
MASTLTETICPKCGEAHEMELLAQEAYHNNQQIDVIVICSGCKTRFNAFLNIDEMAEIE